uniref:Uncharacterized protein n=1 Tax=Setaria italica TaxID=4555 RepID=K4ANN3_SETIT
MLVCSACAITSWCDFLCCIEVRLLHFSILTQSYG